MTKIYAQGEVELKAACHAIMFLDPVLEWEIDVNKKKKRRSSSQNALMWMWLDKIAKAMSDKTATKFTKYTSYLRIISWMEKRLV